MYHQLSTTIQGVSHLLQLTKLHMPSHDPQWGSCGQTNCARVTLHNEFSELSRVQTQPLLCFRKWQQTLCLLKRLVRLFPNIAKIARTSTVADWNLYFSAQTFKSANQSIEVHHSTSTRHPFVNLCY